MQPTAEVMAQVPLARSYLELFRVTGPLLSLVLRAEDVWQRYNQYIEVCGTLNQGFPFSPLQCRQGRTRMNEGAAMNTMHAVIVLWVLIPTSGESFRNTTGVYSRPSQLFINKIVYIRAYARASLAAVSVATGPASHAHPVVSKRPQ
jgi:hypothetical protein